MEASDHNPTAAAHSVPNNPTPASENATEAQEQTLCSHPIEEWIAPYHSYFGKAGPSEYGGTYTVYFFPNHSLTAHQDFLGFNIIGAHRSSSYEAVLPAEKLAQVRRDPGVEKVLEGCPGSWRYSDRKNENEIARAMLESDKPEAATMMFFGDSSAPMNIASTETELEPQRDSQEWVSPYRPYDGNQGPCQRYDRYIVEFFQGHTLEKHRERVGAYVGGIFCGFWYQGILSEDVRERVRRDPGVSVVQQCGPASWGHGVKKRSLIHHLKAPLPGSYLPA